jgi:hypothetical protein
MIPHRAECPSYPVSIFMAGDTQDAEKICRTYCDESGFCVTVSYANYVYTGGEEDGFVVGLINYPRFPKTSDQIWARAEELAAMLRDNLGQQSYSIQALDRTVWISFRAQDIAA